MKCINYPKSPIDTTIPQMHQEFYNFYDPSVKSEIISEPFSMELLNKLIYFGFRINKDFIITHKY